MPVPSNPPDDHISAVFYQLLRIRMFEEVVSERYQEEKMRCPVHFSIGQESAAVSTCLALTREDIVFSSHRAHAHYLAKGGSMKALLAELYGKATGCSGGKGGSMHLIDRSVGFWGSVPILGSTIPIAVGVAFGRQLQKSTGLLTVVFLGDGATEEGVFYESLNFAVLKKLPVVFLCENNQLSVSTTRAWRRSEKTDLIKIVEGFGISAFRKKDTDCVALNLWMQGLFNEIRHQPAPIYLEILTERYTEHCGPKIERQKSDKYGYGKTDPVSVLTQKIPEAHYQEMVSKIRTEIEEAFAFAEASAFPVEENHVT